MAGVRVLHIITPPMEEAAFPKAGAISHDKNTPTPTVTNGVTRISTFVEPATILPISAVIIATNNTASGPPAPPSAFDANPAVTSENRTKAGHFKAFPIATAIAGPLISVASPPTV